VNITDTPTISWENLNKVSAGQVQQMFTLATGRYGMDTRLLMEHIGRDVAELVGLLAPEGPVLVVAGRGNNGGAGLAAARLLAAQGRSTWVVPTHEAENYSGAPKEQLEQLQSRKNVRVRSSLPKMKFACALDAAVGTQLEGPPRGRTLDVITVLNQLASCLVVALDAPTGLMADDGSTPGEVVKASATLSLGPPKTGVQPGGHVGELFISDLGFPAELYADMGLTPLKLAAGVARVVQ
jgi:NAD(P)H-hydrate epimerase